jgi:hydrogenase/urease accessory protein HupE
MSTVADANGGSVTVSAGTAATAQSVGGGTGLISLMLDFLVQGIRHILKGWDHIFFVIGIILVAPTLRILIKVITAFTIAHSITLILTSLEILKISRPQIVEAVIAASVAYVGLENLLLNNRPIPWRWGLVFGFGLIHGMGFASVLRELLGAGGATAGSKAQLIACLLTFNVGVEIGQMLILCLIWPALQALRQRKAHYAKIVVIAVSVLIIFMGTSFLIDRTVAPGRLPWVAWFNG